MHSKWVFKHFEFQKKGHIPTLAMLWVLGLVTGIVLCGVSASNATNVFWDVLSTSPKPLGSLLVCLLPVSLVALLAVPSLAKLTYFLLPVLAVFHGFCGMCVYLAVGDGVWLLRPMLLFASSSVAVLVWQLIFRICAGRQLQKYICSTLLASCLIFIIDMFLISPFVGDLTKVLLEGFA